MYIYNVLLEIFVCIYIYIYIYMYTHKKNLQKQIHIEREIITISEIGNHSNTYLHTHMTYQISKVNQG